VKVILCTKLMNQTQRRCVADSSSIIFVNAKLALLPRLFLLEGIVGVRLKKTPSSILRKYEISRYLVYFEEISLKSFKHFHFRVHFRENPPNVIALRHFFKKQIIFSSWCAHLLFVLHIFFGKTYV
jgi:hypothetical protein